MFEMQVILSTIGFITVTAWVLWVTLTILEFKNTSTKKGKTK